MQARDDPDVAPLLLALCINSTESLMLIQLLSRIPGLKQQGVVYVSDKHLKATNTNTKETATLARRDNHPRSLINDFGVVEQEFIDVLSQIFKHKWIRSDLLICLLGKNDGGYTSIEKRAFREVGYGAGAKNVFLAEKEISPHIAAELFHGKLHGYTIDA